MLLNHTTEYYTIIKVKVIKNLLVLSDGILNDKCVMQSYTCNMIKTIKSYVDLFTKNRIFPVMWTGLEFKKWKKKPGQIIINLWIWIYGMIPRLKGNHKVTISEVGLIWKTITATTYFWMQKLKPKRSVLLIKLMTELVLNDVFPHLFSNSLKMFPC